ncbi:2,3,4,5-tetrahydropyridine-2,6-carboxylate N-succinyltransferase [Desulfurispirillum indicum S5]|uniref:2,3,4,5-tetrahydropyridine-2,6-carboxylate N-succinyltransferase n=1 Tax=Desulfurispirillum indicum (strain ATCC BAA-1389 / DSM 22839 / S5) TaxID=653733 RepID=E6W1X2_DESIS|nr:2,3,4,5-tetrahydropyridine-2,6-dicarboxylate N-succinyltransferase [Desulfurispirillum indicum]ADU65504.1 2,3,4,5-tetrahydropyridine-2,6-carboxylate N-succinyltransferase [Desulfurispirillum indicum S5]
MNLQSMEKLVTEAFGDRQLLKKDAYAQAVLDTIAALDSGMVRVAEPQQGQTQWKVNIWAKQAILLYFSLTQMEVMESGPFEYYDKMPLKKGYQAAGVRVVPPATVRYGAHIESGAILMPSYVNIGGYVSAGSMVDTWATVGSCAQVGKGVHLSGGVGLGGVLEPPSALPVIIDDGAFLGSRCIVVEGVHVEKEAVLGANVTITASTPIIDVTGPEPVTYKGRVPARSVVIPGSMTKSFPAGDFGVTCALIIGKRKESTDQKTSLNDVLREFNVPV